MDASLCKSMWFIWQPCAGLWNQTQEESKLVPPWGFRFVFIKLCFLGFETDLPLNLETLSQFCRIHQANSMWSSCFSRYATIYTMFPVFSLVLDQDVKPEMAILYPELYKDLTKVRPRASLT